MRSKLYERVREARKLTHLTQEALALDLAVTRSAVAQWEMAGGTAPAVEHLIALARRSGLTFEYLATGRGERVFGEPLSLAEEAAHYRQLSDQQARLLEGFEKLSPRQRAGLLDLIGAGKNALRRDIRTACAACWSRFGTSAGAAAHVGACLNSPLVAVASRMPDPALPRPSLATLLRQPERPAPEQAAAAAQTDAGAGAAGATEASGTDGPAAPRSDTAPAPASIPEPVADAPLAAAARAPASAASERGTADIVAPAPIALPAGTTTPPPAPSFMQRGAARRPLPLPHAAPWQWIALAGLGLSLAVQILVADRQRLGADARWRPWVAGVCQVLRCSLPPWREPGAFTMLSREVRPLPGRTDTLQIQATFRNDAHWAQAWPLLQLSLADADGRTVGSRVLRPEEYLGRNRPDAATLAPGQSAQVAFQVREPAAGTAAFSFDFH